jgi:galactonate dehydratase
MKITGVTTHLLSSNWAAIDDQWADTGSFKSSALVRIETDAGITGLGEIIIGYFAPEAVTTLVDYYIPHLIGKDPLQTTPLWNRMYESSKWWGRSGAAVSVISGIDIALWDIKGKALGVPVYEMLGGKCREQCRVYANGWSFRCVTPSDFAREAARVVEDGYSAIKFYPLATAERDRHGHIRHVSGRSIDRDAERLAIARVKAVRDAVGPDVDIMLDMSAELTTDAIIRLGRQLEGQDIFFLEEPVDPFDVEALKKVSEHVHVPIAVGERIYTRYGFRPILELRAADILQPDIGTTGGIMETKKIAAMAEAYNMRIQPHNCASPVSTAAALQLDACISNFLIQELYPYRVPEHFQLVDHAPELDVHHGFIPIPARPGLGVELVEERVQPFLWAECRL